VPACRVTLTYNLYHVSEEDSPAAAEPPRFLNAGQSLFGESLAACLKDGSWHSKGASLGFALEHCYAADSKLPAKLEPDMLKVSMTTVWLLPDVAWPRYCLDRTRVACRTASSQCGICTVIVSRHWVGSSCCST
jgi:hypothetical protein